MWTPATLLLLGALVASAAAGLSTRYDQTSGRILLLSDRGGDEVEVGYIEASSNQRSAVPRHETRGNEESFDFGASRVLVRHQDRSGECLWIRHTKDNPNEIITMCQRHLRSHIYGGVESTYRTWPIENNVYKHYAYVAEHTDHATIATRYWVFSDGRLVHVHTNVPLFVDQNTNQTSNKLCFSAENASPYPEDRSDNVLEYELCTYGDAKEAHLVGIQKYLGKPTAIPDERLGVQPFWEVGPPEQNVRERAAGIIEHGFGYSLLEIANFWESCRGSFTPDTTKFPDMKALVDDLHALGFPVALWIHPFINSDCEPFFSEAQSKGYFVRNNNGSTSTRWWGGWAGIIDFTNPDAVAWWTDRVAALRNETGVDSFMFDFGETSYLPQPPQLTPLERTPVVYTDAYAKAVAQFGPMARLRSGVESQRLPNFFHMDAVDTAWSTQNGLKTLLPKLLEMSLQGYPFVMPERVGGSTKTGVIATRELYIRWLEASAFMPAVHFRTVPWDYDNETVELARNLTALRAQYGTKIVELMKQAVEDGTPVNRPIWWLDPTDSTALKISDEYLLGDDLLVAPVMYRTATRRDIYLPTGYWRDEVDPEHPTIRGPTWLYAYPAPLNTLPYFTRVSS
ncbi:myogenesis-regulating glycosidase-like [Schistocerca americana]|uniref:myogenesis-regulating glycosidase-like n=1 Tax=Schistocerca americana TaxID=7009 RepID=UPI001F4F62C2|nr:myogenesis-regulating glycosidase-like [Schistocerca americana]